MNSSNIRINAQTFGYRPLLMSSFWIEPCHEIMVLFVLLKLILQTRMRSHPVGLDRCLIGPFIYFHTSCVRTAKAVMRLHGCEGSGDCTDAQAHLSLRWSPMWSTIISWAGSIGLFQQISVYMWPVWCIKSEKTTNRLVFTERGFYCNFSQKKNTFPEKLQLL